MTFPRLNPQDWANREVALTIAVGALLAAAISALLLFVFPGSAPAVSIGDSFLYRALFGSGVVAAMGITMAILKRPSQPQARRKPTIPRDEEQLS